MDWIRDSIAGGVFYDVVKQILGAAFVTLLAIPPLKYVFGLLKEKKEIVIFSVCFFFISVTFFSFVGAPPSRPNFVGSIQSVTVGDGNDTTGQVAVIPLVIVNNGTMQSVATGRKVTATYNGATYPAQFVPMPESFTFKQKTTQVTDALGVVFHNSDILVGKLAPVAPGGALSGILFVSFPNVDPSLFRSGPEYQVSFYDALGKSYVLTLQGTANIGKLTLIPGLHMDAICPPPNVFQPKNLKPDAFTPVPKN